MAGISTGASKPKPNSILKKQKEAAEAKREMIEASNVIPRV